MREAAWIVLLAVVVTFIILVALEVGKRSEYRSPVERVADLFTRPNVRDAMPVAASAAGEDAPIVAATADQLGDVAMA